MSKICFAVMIVGGGLMSYLLGALFIHLNAQRFAKRVATDKTVGK